MTMPLTSSRWVHGLVSAMLVAALGACRDPAELSGAVTAVLVVVDVDADHVVDVEIDGLALRARPKSGDNLVSFNLALPTGTHTGTIVVSEVDDDEERPRDCGTVTVVVPADRPDGPVFSAVVADDLGECAEQDDGDDSDDRDDGADIDRRDDASDDDDT
jgi:hypothetical protein